MVKFDTEKTGFETVFKPYQWEVIKLIYEVKNGIGSGAIHKAVTEKGITISRASVIFFCTDMLEEGVFTFLDRTGKGGHHKIYQPAFITLGKAIDHIKKKLKDSIEAELKL